jgi:hypothetical protein
MSYAFGTLLDSIGYKPKIMKTKFYSFLFIVILIPSLILAQTQNGVISRETFGAGTSKASLPSGRTTFDYSSNTYFSTDEYQLYSKTSGHIEWHSITDHTGDQNGRAMLVKATSSSNEFYRDTVTGLTAQKYYTVSLYVLNLRKKSTCLGTTVLPRIQIIAEAYNSAKGTFQQLQSFTSIYFPQTSNAAWVYTGINFLLPAGFTSVRYRVINKSSSGCGNDLAIDDISFQTTSLTLLPVTGFTVSAVRTNSNVQVKWQTLSETNNIEFIVQKSSNGTDWTAIATVASAGNSNSKKEYSITDQNPGTKNYYRIQQVDFDGQFDYSNTTSLYMSTITKTATFPNPFVSAVQVNISSEETQTVTILLQDLIGRTVQQMKWTIQKGNNSTSINNLSQLPKGMYMISINGENGEQLYNSKLMK